MLLKIQSDEALDSYLTRTFHIFPEYRKTINPLKIKLTSSSSFWQNQELKLLAQALGWDGCVGYNKLLHYHTDYFESAYIKHSKDKAYSQNFFTSDHSPLMYREEVRLCLECVTSDISKLGFAYWRRSHQSCNEVCGIHNVILSRCCQFCQRIFSIKGKGHFFDILWQGCICGKSVVDGNVIYNEDELSLKKAKLYLDIYKYDYHVDSFVAYETIVSRFMQDGYSSWSTIKSIDEYYRHRLAIDMRADMIKNLDWFFTAGHGLFNINQRLIINIIFMLFEDFDEFVSCMLEVSNIRVPISFTWRGYVEGNPYVREPKYVVSV